MKQKITLLYTNRGRFSKADPRPLEDMNPKELLLYAAADCLGHTILTMLKDHSESLHNMELTVEGTLSSPTLVAESTYTSFHITYRAECKHMKDQTIISRAINLANDKYCGMLAMLRKIAPTTHETSIVTTGESEQ